MRVSASRRQWLRIAAVVGICMQAGCRQVPVGTTDNAVGTDGTFDPEKTQEDDTIPIEKELAAPKGFFNRTKGPTGAWSSQAREIERSLGVGR